MSFGRVLHWSIRLGQTAWGLILAGTSVLVSCYLAQSQDYLSAAIADKAPVSRAALLSGMARGEVVVEGRISANNETMAQACC